MKRRRRASKKPMTSKNIASFAVKSLVICLGALASDCFVARGPQTPAVEAADRFRLDPADVDVGFRSAIDDVQFAVAREKLASGDFIGAATEIASIEQSNPLADRCALAYIEARLYSLGNSPDAPGAWDRAASWPLGNRVLPPVALARSVGIKPSTNQSPPSVTICPLGDFALLRSAQAYLKADQPMEALVRLRSIPVTFALYDDVRAAIAEVHLHPTAPRTIHPAPPPSHTHRTPRPIDHHPHSCRDAIVQAQAHPKPRAVAADLWEFAILRCTEPDDLAIALYSGGRASFGAHRLDEAEARFSALERRFPQHRLADDSRIFRSEIALDQGDSERATTLLHASPDDYPHGDMRIEAFFRVALIRMRSDDWAAAIPPLNRAASLEAAEPRWASFGRIAYFRARAEEMTNGPHAAVEMYRQVIANYPLTFAMVQAFSRLSEYSVSAARAAVDDASARDAIELDIAAPETASARTTAHFALGASLLSVGDIEAARKEWLHDHIIGEHAPPELQWRAARFLSAAGSPEHGHVFSRTRWLQFAQHYPTGKWREGWLAAFPLAFRSSVETRAREAGIPKSLVWAIMREESAYNAEARSAADAFGLMQLIAAAAKDAARGTTLSTDAASLVTADTSIALGSRFLRSLRDRFQSNPQLAVPAYNAGSGAVDRWIAEFGTSPFDVWVELIPWEETRLYLKRVLSSEAAYSFLYARNEMNDVFHAPPFVR